MAEKLIRCICGAVYKLSNEAKCPACGENPQPSRNADVARLVAQNEEEIIQRASQGERAAAKKEFGAQQGQEPYIKVQLRRYTYLLCIVLALGFILLRSFSAKPATQMDPLMIGSWTLDFPGIQGVSHWQSNILNDGTFLFSATGPGAPAAYSGKMDAKNGTWRIYDTTNHWTDSGTYHIENENTLFLNGKLGLGIWKK